MSRSKRLLFLIAACSALSLAPFSARADVSSIRVRLHPYLAPKGELPQAALDRLEALAGASLTLVGVNRTGALELALSAPIDEAALKTMLRQLRDDRMILWAEPVRPANVQKSAKATPDAPIGKLMVRLKDDGADINSVLPQFAARLGQPVAVERQTGNVWVLRLQQAQPADALANLAAALQDDPAVQYADPVRRARPMLIPNDTYFGQQWSLTNPVAGINAPAAWDLGTGSSMTTVAVVDTGIQAHPDLTGRILPGFNFISDPGRARNSNGRGPDATDNGDWTGDNECFPGSFGEPSSWHGTFVSGIIGANSNNGIGVAGINWNAMIQPVRVLGKCGGTFDDILAGMMWAAGVPIGGAPTNTTPARVINMSLGGEGTCDQAIQEAVDDALATGVIIVVAAGNSQSDASQFTPASCSGVVTVGALAINGDRASYSNFGTRVDISAPGGDFSDTNQSLVVSLSNDGLTVPGNPAYAFEAGTSFASPHVAGTVSLMLARNPMLTAGRALDIMQGTSRDFGYYSPCSATGLCGTGLLDAGFAVGSTIPPEAAPPPNAVTVVEYYRADLDHYFITSSPAEMASIDNNPLSPFKRTGLVFYAYADAIFAPPGVQPVCRFFAGGVINSHYYTANAAECQFVQQHWAGTWFLETAAAFFVLVPDAAGTCPANTLPVYRFFNNRNDANHRYTLDLSVRRAMINRQWIPEGNGANSVVFCSPY